MLKKYFIKSIDLVKEKRNMNCKDESTYYFSYAIKISCT